MKYTIQSNDDYVYVTMSGKMDHNYVETDLRFFPDVAQACIDNQCCKILVDLTEMALDIDFVDRYKMSNQLEETMLVGTQIALFDRRYEEAGFLQFMVQEMGFQWEYFDTKEQAMAWLQI